MQDQEDSSLSCSGTEWALAAIVEVNHADRIQCQCKGCGQTVFKRVHVILFASGEIECWGSGCYARELGIQRPRVEPLYSSSAGRRLTDQERELLRGNREKLIAEFRVAKERELAAAAEHAKAQADLAAEEERLRLEAAAEAAAREHLALKSRGRVGSLRPPAQSPPARSRPEPMDDPLYREIRDRLATRWAAQGIDVERPGQKAMFLENVRAEYVRRGGRR